MEEWQGKASKARRLVVASARPFQLTEEPYESAPRHDDAEAGADAGAVRAVCASNQDLEALPEPLVLRLSSCSSSSSLAAHLRELDLSFNRLVGLPAALSCLSQLELLNLSHNAFEQVPSILLASSSSPSSPSSSSPPPLASLRHLILSANRLSSLPDGLAGLTLLENLLLSDNRFERWPPVVHRLPSLRSLSLAHNRMRSPIAMLVGKERKEEEEGMEEEMVETGVSGRRFMGLCRRIKSIDLSGNAITELDLDLPASLTSLDLSLNTSLSLLSLRQAEEGEEEEEEGRGKSSASPPKRRRGGLRWLNISGCGLASMPHSLAGLDRLVTLRFGNNPWDHSHAFLRTNPLSSAVLAWLRIRGERSQQEHAGLLATIPANGIQLDPEEIDVRLPPCLTMISL